MINKKHDMVETNLMASEDVGSLIDVTRAAKADLDNGRLVVREDGEYVYATAEATEVYLVTTPEVTYAGEEFFNKAGRKVRVVKVMEEDVFSTTAIEGDIAAGEEVEVGTDGKLVAGATGAVVFTVLSKRVLGGRVGVTVERTK